LLELNWAQYEIDENRNLLLNPLKQNQSLDLSRYGTQSTKRQPIKVRSEQLGETPLIRLAKETDSVESLASLTALAAEKTLLNKADFLGVTPLITAVVCRNYAAVEVFLSNGVKINQADIHGFTPLHFAAYLRDKKMLNMLLGAKVKPNLLNDN
jgi:ankyrin repeat protein